MRDYIEEKIIEQVAEAVETSTKNKTVRGQEVDYVDWNEVVCFMELCGAKRTKDAWRVYWNYHKGEVSSKVEDKEYKRVHDVKMAELRDKDKNRFALEDRILGMVKTKRSMTYILDKLEFVTEDMVALAILRLQLRGYNIVVWEQDNETFVENVIKLEQGQKDYKNLIVGKEIKIALIGDTHLGHCEEALDELVYFYNYAYSQGVVDFFHVGDLTDGYYKNRDSSIYEQHKIGFKQQLDYVVDVYPNIDGVTTYFITGNHDESHIRNGGANIGEVVSKFRKDMVYLGHNFAKVWLTQAIDLNLVHPNDGSSTAISAKAQKIVDSAVGRKRCKILGIGHYHKMNWIYYKGTHAFAVPSFQHQTTFMEGNNLQSYVGGYILTIKVDVDGNLLSITPEYVELDRQGIRGDLVND